ncbi:hypothetical protein MVEN_02595100 [Mycena venus]|uniref:Uncharacterized protein n=1 Tax=Mycena venus TaxID=2733690 RepID=A0A8H6WRD7_9AGAR|nr:hypothetical protein MVEN_02595100 [Mycena venus]
MCVLPAHLIPLSNSYFANLDAFRVPLAPAGFRSTRNTQSRWLLRSPSSPHIAVKPHTVSNLPIRTSNAPITTIAPDQDHSTYLPLRCGSNGPSSCRSASWVFVERVHIACRLESRIREKGEGSTSGGPKIVPLKACSGLGMEMEVVTRGGVRRARSPLFSRIFALLVAAAGDERWHTIHESVFVHLFGGIRAYRSLGTSKLASQWPFGEWGCVGGGCSARHRSDWKGPVKALHGASLGDATYHLWRIGEGILMDLGLH